MATPASKVAQRRKAHANAEVATKADVRRLERRLRRLEETLEDRLDAEESERLLNDPATKWAAWPDAKKRLGL